MTVSAYAKVNLTLEVLGVRDDGYHDIRSVVLPISLSDTLTLADAADGVVVSDGPYGDDDLAARAAKALLADAAATLLALNEMWGLGKTPMELAAIGAGVGSDVPSLVLAQHFRHPVLMEGRGERVRVLGDVEVAPLGIGDFIVLANPQVRSSTAEVYARCRPGDGTAQSLANGLQEAACELHPEIAAAIVTLSDAGAEKVMMSGSGATAFGFADDEQSAERIAARVTAAGFVSFVVRPLSALSRCR